MTALRVVGGGRTDSLVKLTGVSRVYGEGAAEVHALRKVDLQVRRGDFVAFMGPSGSGKSTCLNVLGCLDVPTAGSYEFAGVEVTGLDRVQRALLRRHYLGFVFQGFNLLARTSAVENVELPLVYRGMSARERRRRAEAALDEVGLLEWGHHAPNELSGGQQQRVAIARALVSGPQLLLADEPTGNLDSERGRDVMRIVQQLNKDRGITIVMVTHEAEIAAYADRVEHFLDGRIDKVERTQARP